MADLKKEYAAKLEKALGDVDFSKVFRIESQSEMLQYDMDKQIFPLKGCGAHKLRQTSRMRWLRLAFVNGMIVSFDL